MGNLLKDICDKGYLVAEGHGRGTKYHIPQVRKASDVSDNLGSCLGSMPSMLEEGLLERMYPQIPKHPYQKYKRK